jgi:phosphoribosylanthranilate isomerase
MLKPRIKICCISSIDEADIAIRAGASALGLVGKMPSGPGVISDEEIYEIAQSVPPPIGTFLLTSETDSLDIVEHYKLTRTNTIQIVDKLHFGTYQEIYDSFPGVKLVQVIHVLDESSVDEACEIAEMVDAILLDSGNPNLEIKELGGTGRIHNWDLSLRIVETCGKPVFLAGGINSENVREAFEKVNPFGFDLCSSVRTNGRLDEGKLEEFFNAVDKI